MRELVELVIFMEVMNSINSGIYEPLVPNQQELYKSLVKSIKGLGVTKVLHSYTLSVTIAIGQRTSGLQRIILTSRWSQLSSFHLVFQLVCWSVVTCLAVDAHEEQFIEPKMEMPSSL